MDLEFSTFQAAQDLDRQRDLFLDCFPETKGTSVAAKEHYHWKFHNFPAHPSSYEYLAQKGTEFYGYYAALPYRYKIGSEELVAAMVCDVMTHSKSRGKGIFTKLGRYATDRLKESGLHFTTGYPIRPEVIPGHLKVGWDIAQELPMYVSPIRLDDYLKKFNLVFLSPIFVFLVSIFHFFIDLLHLPVLIGDSNYRIQLATKEEFLAQPELALFIQNWSSEIENCLIKSKDFLQWRLSAPSTKYQFFLLSHQEVLVGVCIARMASLKSISTLALLDFMILNAHRKRSYLLVRAIKQYARSNKVNLIAIMTSRYIAGRYRLLRAGFLRSPVVFKLIVKQLNFSKNKTEFYDEKKWHLSWIDTDDL